ncbi:hypothetical protein JCM10213v2_002331 [Rhodosporidiobolus nylandii]
MSANRASSSARPQRDWERGAPVLGWPAAAGPMQGRPRQSSGESWVDLGANGVVSGGGATPTAQRTVPPAGVRGYATPPRRDSSLVSTSTTALASSPHQSTFSQLVASPPFFASTPPTSDGGHDGFSLDAASVQPAPAKRHQREATPQNGISQALFSPVSPSSSFIRSGPTPSATVYADAGAAVVGLPPSSSFYNFNSPASPPRLASRSRRAGNGSLATGEEPETQQESPIVQKTAPAKRQDSAGEGAPRRPGRRESMQATGLPPLATPPHLAHTRPGYRASSLSPSRAAPNGNSSPLAALSNASTTSLAKPTPAFGIDAPNPAARSAYNAFAAFLGTPSGASISPAFSGASTFDSPILGRTFSSPAASEQGSGVTPGTSTDGEDSDLGPALKTPSDEKTQALASKPALGSPAKLASTASIATEQDFTTPTQQTFPLPRSSYEQPRQPSPREAVPLAAFGQLEKVVIEPLVRSPHSSAEQPRSPVEQQPEMVEQQPQTPAKTMAATAKSESTTSASSVGPLYQQQQPSPPSGGLPPSHGVDPSSQPSPRAAKPPPAPLELASLSSPPRSRSLESPRTARAPLTPKSPEFALVPLELKASNGPSPKKRVTADGTKRAAALAAARDREKKAVEVAREELVEGVQQDPQEPEELVRRPRFEFAFSVCSTAILHPLLQHISFNDLISLRQVSQTVRRAIDVDGKEVVLERFLGSQGYRSFATATKKTGVKARYIPPPDTIQLDLRDLLAFRAGLSLTPDDYARLARSYTAAPPHFSPTSLKLARATTRAWNRVVLRLRSQALVPAQAFNLPAFPDLAPASQPVHKTGRAASLRVWVPIGSTAAGESWMTDQEVVECEREVWRSTGAWAQLRKGDVVTNVAAEEFGNCAKLIFDGRFLRDLAFLYDVVGHLPARLLPYQMPWLNMLAFSPSFFHNIIVSSSSNPIFYLSLAPFLSMVRETIQLCNDRVGLTSPQGNYVVKKRVLPSFFLWAYRAGFRIKAGQMVSTEGGVGGSGPGGIEVVHNDWVGDCVLETDGTTEHATQLIARVASVEPTPWRILRSKCRPGKLWLKPVLDNEAC